VRQTEVLVARLQKGGTARAAGAPLVHDANVVDVENKLRGTLRQPRCD